MINQPQSLPQLLRILQQVPDLWQHSSRVAWLARRIGEAVGLPPTAVAQLHQAGQVHDVGKLTLPTGLWHNTGPLTAADWALVRQHPNHSAQTLRNCGADDLAAIVVQHHERWDGSGYPSGRAGEQIHPAARILAVADTVVAICSDRPYRNCRPYHVALQVLQSGAGLQFDPALVGLFVGIWPACHPPAPLTLPLPQLGVA